MVNVMRSVSVHVTENGENWSITRLLLYYIIISTEL